MMSDLQVSSELRATFMCTLWKHDERMMGILDRYFHSRDIHTFDQLLEGKLEETFSDTSARKEEKELFFKNLSQLGIWSEDNDFTSSRSH